MDDVGMRDVKARFFGQREPTDVIAFTYAPLPGEPPRRSHGEILVNVERALARTSRRRSAGRELALYLAHGCDHLAGADDRTGRGRRAMRRRELRWVQAGHRLGLLTALLKPSRSIGRQPPRRRCS
jgi:rRNA maturation RNase YbeY